MNTVKDTQRIKSGYIPLGMRLSLYFIAFGLTEQIQRIQRQAEVYDALSDDRPYRKGMEREQVRTFFQEKRGIMFDPQLTNVFLELMEIKEI